MLAEHTLARQRYYESVSDRVKRAFLETKTPAYFKSLFDKHGVKWFIGDKAKKS